MKTPYQLLEDFRVRHGGETGGFAMSRLILLARIIPEDITPELEDPVLAQRLSEAIARIEAYEAKRAQVKQMLGSA